MVPRLLPIAALAGLLLLRPNRRPAAWALLIPLVASLAFLRVIQMGLGNTADAANVADVISSGLYAVAVVWGVMHLFTGKHRAVTWFMSFVLAAFGGLFALITSQWPPDFSAPWFAKALLVVLGLLAAMTSLMVAALLCRRVYRPGILLARVALTSCVLWLVIFAPIVLSVMIAARTAAPLGEMLKGFFIAWGGTFGVLLPFILFCFVNSTYRERLKAMLHLTTNNGPPVLKPGIVEAAHLVQSR